MSYADTLTKAQDNILSTVEQFQDSNIKTVESFSKAVGEQLPSLAVDYPTALPRPRDLVADAFDYAGKWLSSQRDFTLGLIDAVSPITEKFVAPAKPAKTTKA